MSHVPATRRMTPDDLARVEGKAELIGGRIVSLSPNGYWHNVVAGEIYSALKSDPQVRRRGIVFTDNMGFVVPRLRSGRESFSPDVAFYDGPLPADKRDFAPGPPTFAVEVRSKGDRGKAAEAALAAKRADYFEAGTLVVWDVDVESRRVTVYRAGDPTRPAAHGPGEEADAEPALPGWRVAVDRLFADPFEFEAREGP